MKNTPTVHLDRTDFPQKSEAFKRIKVHDNLEDPHRIIKKTEKALLRAKPDERGSILPSGKRTLDIYVTPKHLNRSLRIMDAILKGLEAAGYKISNEGAVTIDGVVIPLSISEKHDRVAHTPTKEEKLEI